MFGVLAGDNDNNDNFIAASIATQVAALNYQSQLTKLTVATTSECQQQQIAQITAVQGAINGTLHHIVVQLNALTFNTSNVGRECFGGKGQGLSHVRGRGRGPPTYVHGYPQGGGFPSGCGFPPAIGTVGPSLQLFPQGPPVGFQGTTAGGPPLYRAPQAMSGRYGPS